jgi:lactate dehydrogenase-like 2-hydroxyacid dehydrogenase
LTPDVLANTRGMAGHLSHGAGRQEIAVAFPQARDRRSFGVGYDHVDSAYAREHNIVVTNTPDVLTEEVADVAMGLLISTCASSSRPTAICAPACGRRRAIR